MPKQHNYEEEYDEYDDWLDVMGSVSHTQLRFTIESRFGLSPISANKLADRLWIIKVQKDRIDDDERELGLPPEPMPRPFSTKKGYETITEWRITSREKGVSEEHIRRIESYLRRNPTATLKEARGH